MKPFKRRITDRANGPATYLAPTAELNGNLSGSGAYIICGRVTGDCDIHGPVTLAKDGHWVGILRADDVVIAGTVEGDVVARERLEISATARISGSISGHSIAVAEGAIIEGDLRVAGGGEPKVFTEKRVVS